MLTKQCLLFCLLFVTANFVTAQSANDTCYKSFLKTYGVSTGTLDFKDVCRTSDGGYVVTGIKGYDGRIILKLNKRAEIIWSTIDGNGQSANRVLESNDGGIIVGGYQTYESQLSKFSNTGAILWSKQYKIGGYSFQLFDLQKTLDGSFVMIFNAALGLGYTFNYIVKVDSLGNLIWCKEILHGVHAPIVKSMLIENNDIYIAADFYNSPINSIDIAKLDLTSGNFIWKKRVEVPGPYLYEPHLIKINDTLCLSTTANYQVSAMVTNRSCVINLNANNGSLLSSYIFVNPELSYNVTYYAINFMGPSHCGKTSDNNLFIAQLTYQNNDTVFNVTKFSPSGSIIWSKNYKNYKKHDVWSVKSDDDGLLIVGRRYVAYPNTTDVAFVMRLNNNGNVTDKTLDPAQDCYNESITASTQPFPVTEMAASNFLSTSDVPSLSVTPYTTTVIPGIITANESCHSVDISCNGLTISGPTTYCLDNTSVTYTGVRNAGCTNPVNWIFDTAFVNAVQYTDSTITLKFRKSGAISLSAKVQGSCSAINANKVVQIFRKAKSLNLGSDVTACFPTNIVLNAHKGFKSYLWNTGVTDSTISVTSAGIYSLQIVDSCGNIAKDTIRINNAGTVPVDLGPDRQKCNNDTIQIQAPSGFTNYSWGPNYNLSNPQSNIAVVNPRIDTAFFVKVETNNGCFGFDTIKVYVKTSPRIFLGEDTSICTGDSILLNAGIGFTEYLWGNGSTSQQISVYTTGQYTVAAKTNEGCYSYDTVRILNIWPKPEVTLQENPALCSGTTRVLDGGNFSSYLWNTGATSQTIPVSSIGLYSVKVTDNNGCKGFDSTIITSIVPLPFKFLAADTSLCIFETLNVQPTGLFKSYVWNTGSNSSGIKVSEPGIYWLQVKDKNGCIGRDSISVSSKYCTTGFYMPSAFSPNNDGKNDIMKPILVGKIKKYQFWIYNRYGELVFTSSTVSNGWDGHYKQLNQPGNVFAWMCTYQFEGEPIIEKKGSFVLIK